MDGDQVKKARHREVPGQYFTAMGAYLLACLVSAVGLTVMNGMAVQFELIGLFALSITFASLIPFLVTKLIMIRFTADDGLPHFVGGAMTAVLAVALFGGARVLTPWVIVSFFLWGGLAGLVYWGARGIGRRLFKGAGA